jgi:hypothetical protein
MLIIYIFSGVSIYPAVLLWSSDEHATSITMPLMHIQDRRLLRSTRIVLLLRMHVFMISNTLVDDELRGVCIAFATGLQCYTRAWTNVHV